ncbi:MAG: diguanylate cyclase [Kofleriaceae bacterium]
MGMGEATVIVVQGKDSAALEPLLRGVRVRSARSTAEVLAQLETFIPDAVVVSVDDEDSPLLGELASRLPAAVRLVAIGDLRSFPHLTARQPDCVVCAPPDEAAMRGALRSGPAVDVERLLHALVSTSLFGVELPTTLQQLARRLASAFDADDCMVMLPQEGSCYTAREVSEQVMTELLPLCETICQFGATVIAPPRTEHPYRAFLGLPLSFGNAPPLALVLLCREAPLSFGHDALDRLRGLAGRLSADLSWRLVHERLLIDRDKLANLSRIDPVLGVANRRALQEELSAAVAKSERLGESFSVAVIDVDGLRLINERNGYPAGDAVLAHVAQVAHRKMRAEDAVARYAGASVAIVMPGTTAADATAVITSVLSAIDATPVLHEGKPINLTVSAGIAELRDSDTGEAALARALAARARARLHGEVIVVADSSVADAPAQPDFAIGTTLGGVYQIRHEISRGAFGVVYRAEDLALGRQVALKLLRPDLARDVGFVERFRIEAATLARVRNPNLVQVYAFGIDGTNVFFAMELVEGQGLDERIKTAHLRQRHLPIPDVIGIIDQVTNALDAVHRAGILHRDVKPENVLVDRHHRRCVLVDVGIALKRGEKHSPAGTPGFTAPEVFGEGGDTPATDVYSLGALAYMLLTLQAPFGEGANAVEILARQAIDRPRAPTEIRPDLPRAVDTILLRTLDADPARRPQSARELAKALADALERPDRSGRRPRPRQTIEPPTVVTERRTLSVNMPSLRPAAALSEPSTRGVLFRSAYELLGARRGSAWIADLSRNLPELAIALGPQSSSLAWHPTSSFVSVLKALGQTPRESRMIAAQLGRSSIDASFNQFYGADPSAVSPGMVLRATDVFWHCYHSWGAAQVSTGATDAEVSLKNGLASSILCASSAGLLAGVVSRAGGQDVKVMHRACLAEGAEHCVFQLTWS